MHGTGPHAAPFATCACLPPAEECDIEPESPGDPDIATTPFKPSSSPPPTGAGAEDNSTADGTAEALLLLAKVNDVLHSKNTSIIAGLDRVEMQTRTWTSSHGTGATSRSRAAKAHLMNRGSAPQTGKGRSALQQASACLLQLHSIDTGSFQRIERHSWDDDVRSSRM